MDSRFYSAGYLAIPLEANETTPLFKLHPQPNWLVIDNIFGKLETVLPVLGNTICRQTVYKIVYRETLEANEQLGRPKEIREIVYENTNQPIPITIVPAFDSHEALQQYVSQVNELLALFQFRGVLEGFTLKIDESVLTEILTPQE